MRTATLPIAKKKTVILPPPFLPYDWQVPIIQAMIDTILAGEKGLVVQPTATGKSVEAAFTARSCILRHHMKGIYLYDENEGLDQARLSFEKIFAENDITCANFFGYGKDHTVDSADMVFASFQSLNNHHNKRYTMFDNTHFDFMIVNEAHCGQAVTYKEVIDYFNCSKIGMTATPERMDGKDILEIFKKKIFEMLLEEAIVKGYVAGIEYHIKSHGLSTKKINEICREFLEEGKRVSIKQLNETIFIDLLDDEVLKEIYSYAFPESDDARQTLIFCENIAHANRVGQLLARDEKKFGVIHSKLGKTHNRAMMRQFRNEEIQFLVSINKLNEDIDVPNVQVAAFWRATDSKTVFFQQLGRNLRKHYKKEKAIILDFVGNCERMVLIKEMEDRVIEFAKKEGFDLSSLERNTLSVSGKGFDFQFSDQVVNVLKMIQLIKDIPTLDIIKQELANKYITDYWSLKLLGSNEFAKMTFGVLGTGHRVATLILGEFYPIVHNTLDKIAAVLEWVPDDETRFEKYKEELAKHGIVDYWTLREVGVKFFKLTFGISKKKAGTFLNLVMGTKDDNRTISKLDKLAKFLNWYPSDEEIKQKVIIELAKYDIKDYWTLKFKIGRYSFTQLDFGFFGKGFGLACFLLRKNNKIPYFTEKVLDEIASALDWIPSEQQTIAKYKEELLKYNITDYQTLIDIGSRFTSLNFGIFGNGNKFCSIILDIQNVRTSLSVLELITKKLNWEKSKINYVEVLKQKGIVDYWTLFEKGPLNFQKLDFDFLGSGRMLACKILNKTTNHITPEHLMEIATKFNWIPTEEEKILKYKEELAKHGIVDYWTLLYVHGWKFIKLDFGFFGKGKNFSKIILGTGDVLKDGVFIILNRLAKVLNWYPSEEEKILKYKEELARYGIKNRESLLAIQFKHFVKLDFGFFGKGTRFIALVLEKPVEGNFRVSSSLNMVADKLNML